MAQAQSVTTADIERVEIHGLRVAKTLYDFINNEALPGTDINPDDFWRDLRDIHNEITPQNKKLNAERDERQRKLNE